MAAPFLGRILGLRGSLPNIADKSSTASCRIAQDIMDQLELSEESTLAGQQLGRALEHEVAVFLEENLPLADSRRHWNVKRGRPVSEFVQYAHLGRLAQLVAEDESGTLEVETGGDYLVRPDVTVGLKLEAREFLHAAVSCKWTIRSDRVQNIRHEGVILTRHRRGRQPHIVTVTAEPLPTRLAAIAKGTGEVDGVYHVAFDELRAAVDCEEDAEQRRVLEMLIDQE